MLTVRQQRFVAEFRIDLNGTQAAIRAGYAPRNARFQASRLLADVGIQEALAAGMSKGFAKAELAAERVDEAIARIAFFDIRTLFRPDGSLLPVDQWPDDAATAVAGIEVIEQFAGARDERAIVGQVKKIRLSDRIAALTLAARRLSLLTDKSADRGEIPWETLVLGALQINVGVTVSGAAARSGAQPTTIDVTQADPNVALLGAGLIPPDVKTSTPEE